MAEHFFRRWARRKAEAGERDERDATRSPADSAPPSPVQADSLPGMRDVQMLHSGSDFSRFVGTGVDPDVRRAALKTLFSDPHFHAMDGLDIYIGDYTQPSPLPAEMLAALWQAKTTLTPQPLSGPSVEPVPEASAAARGEDGAAAEHEAARDALSPETDENDDGPGMTASPADLADEGGAPARRAETS